MTASKGFHFSWCKMPSTPFSLALYLLALLEALNWSLATEVPSPELLEMQVLKYKEATDCWTANTEAHTLRIAMGLAKQSIGAKDVGLEDQCNLQKWLELSEQRAQEARHLEITRRHIKIPQHSERKLKPLYQQHLQVQQQLFGFMNEEFGEPDGNRKQSRLTFTHPSNFAQTPLVVTDLQTQTAELESNKRLIPLSILPDLTAEAVADSQQRRSSFVPPMNGSSMREEPLGFISFISLCLILFLNCSAASFPWVTGSSSNSDCKKHTVKKTTTTHHHHMPGTSLNRGGACILLMLISSIVIVADSTNPLHANNNNSNDKDELGSGIRKPIRPFISFDTRFAPLGGCTNLECWLQSLVIHIPDQKFQGPLGLFTGTLSHATCRGISLVGLNSSLVPPAGAQVKAYGASINCSLEWGIQTALFTSQGTASAHVSDSSLDLTLQLIKDADGLASEAKMTACTSDINIKYINFQGDLGDFLDYFRSEIISILSSVLDSTVCSELKTAIDTNLTNVLQEIDDIIRPWLHPGPPQPPPIVPAGMINLLEEPAMDLIDYLLNDVVGTDGALGMNKIGGFFTNGTGNFSLVGLKGLQHAVPLASMGNMIVGLQELNITGLNTWSAFSLFVPVTRHELVSFSSLDHLELSIRFFVNVTTNSTVESGNYLYEEGVLKAALNWNKLNSTLQLAIQESIHQLNNKQLLVPGCVLHNLYDAFIIHLNFSFALDLLQLLATNGGTEEQLDEAISNVFALFTSAFQPAIPVFFNGMIGGPVKNMANMYVSSWLQTDLPCVDPKDPPTWSTNGVIAASSSTGAAFLAIVVLLIAMSLCISKIPPMPSGDDVEDPQHHHHDDLIDGGADGGLYMSPMPGAASCCGTGSSYDRLVFATAYPGSHASQNKWFSSLALSPRLPLVIRYGIPMLLLFNIALFVTSNTSIGASVYAVVTLGEDKIQPPSLFDFTLATSVRDMWEAEVYALSILIAVFSGGWPYVKLVLMLICWLIPVALLSRRKREWVMMVLDALGKWSLIDAFVLVFMMVAFHFVIIPPHVDGVTPPGEVQVEAFVVPHWGFYSFLFATMLSLVTTHIILALHRWEARATKKPASRSALRFYPRARLSWSGPTKHNKSNESEDEASDGLLSQHHREVPHKEQQHHLLPPEGYAADEDPPRRWEALRSYAGRRSKFLARYSIIATLFITVALLASIGLVTAGVIEDSFDFNFRGAFGLLLEFLGDPTTKPYSVITLGLALPSSSMEPDFFGIRVIQATWFSFAMVMPLGYLVLLLVLWLAPMTPRLQRAVFVLTEVFNAWSALEVVVISVIAALLELRQFAQFIIGDKCNLINPILEQYFGQLLDNDPKCFDVVATLDSGCWLLFSACLLYLVVGMIVQITCHKAIEHREKAQENDNNNGGGASDHVGGRRKTLGSRGSSDTTSAGGGGGGMVLPIGINDTDDHGSLSGRDRERL